MTLFERIRQTVYGRTLSALGVFALLLLAPFAQACLAYSPAEHMALPDGRNLIVSQHETVTSEHCGRASIRPGELPCDEAIHCDTVDSIATLQKFSLAGKPLPIRFVSRDAALFSTLGITAKTTSLTKQYNARFGEPPALSPLPIYLATLRLRI
jgi:hypothetical protein